MADDPKAAALAKLKVCLGKFKEAQDPSDGLSCADATRLFDRVHQLLPLLLPGEDLAAHASLRRYLQDGATASQWKKARQEFLSYEVPFLEELLKDTDKPRQWSFLEGWEKIDAPQPKKLPLPSAITTVQATIPDMPQLKVSPIAPKTVSEPNNAYARPWYATAWAKVLGLSSGLGIFIALFNGGGTLWDRVTGKSATPTVVVPSTHEPTLVKSVSCVLFDTPPFSRAEWEAAKKESTEMLERNFRLGAQLEGAQELQHPGRKLSIDPVVVEDAETRLKSVAETFGGFPHPNSGMKHDKMCTLRIANNAAVPATWLVIKFKGPGRFAWLRNKEFTLYPTDEPQAGSAVDQLEIKEKLVQGDYLSVRLWLDYNTSNEHQIEIVGDGGRAADLTNP